MDLALKQYTLDKIALKIAELRQRDIKYQEKYQLDYSTFCQQIYEDEDFIKQVENLVSKTWEIDLADWEFCHQGVEDWIQKFHCLAFTHCPAWIRSRSTNQNFFRFGQGIVKVNI